MVHRTSISSYLHWCRNWCTQGPIHDNRLFIVDILPANQPFLEARPAGFEPATRGLEVRCSVLLSYGRIGLTMRITPRPGEAIIPGGSNAAAIDIKARHPEH